MTNTNLREFSVDNASILFLSLIRPYHTNSFRFSVTLNEAVCPVTLQQAVDRIHPRFPSLFAGFRQKFYHFRQVASSQPPVVRPDPGLLHPMNPQEIRDCALRVYYHDKSISIEAFHALTDGCGAITMLTTLLSEYLNILHTSRIPTGQLCLDSAEPPQSHEVEDDYLKLKAAKPRHLPSRFSYLPERPQDADWQVRHSLVTMDTDKLLNAARRHGVTLNTLLTSIMASSLMELQLRERHGRKLKPVRIMVPINLRKMIGSRTLRNCSLYSLPTMETKHRHLPFKDLCKLFESQLKSQLSEENQASMVSYNVRTQNAWYFRMLPWKLKAAAMRFGYRFFGESNSSLTLTNLGRVSLPDEMLPYVSDFRCFMTPRVSSPYGCTVLSFGNKLVLNMCRFCPEDKLGKIFFRKLNELVSA